MNENHTDKIVLTETFEVILDVDGKEKDESNIYNLNQENCSDKWIQQKAICFITLMFMGVIILVFIQSINKEE
tara:strand:+ start:393 stop:611 length:219 start_codon:yes stop_codon:yes gene_type:complete